MAKSGLTRGLRDQIALELRNDIVAGHYAPGMQMVERNLAQRFGVSHAPIREALLLLAHEGLLVSHTNRGAQVAPALPPALRRFFTVIRTTLESYALGLGFDALDDEDFRSWDRLLSDLSDARARHDSAAMAEADFAFHESIISCGGQPDVVAAWRTVIARARLYANEWAAPGESQVDDAFSHQRVVQACRDKALKEAQHALEGNVQAEMRRLETAVPRR